MIWKYVWVEASTVYQPISEMNIDLNIVKILESPGEFELKLAIL